MAAVRPESFIFQSPQGLARAVSKGGPSMRGRLGPALEQFGNAACRGAESLAKIPRFQA